MARCCRRGGSPRPTAHVPGPALPGGPAGLPEERSDCGASSRGRLEDRPPDGVREDVIQVEVDLPEEAKVTPAVTIDGDQRLKPDLDLLPSPDHARVDSAGRALPVEVVGDRREHRGFDNR